MSHYHQQLSSTGCGIATEQSAIEHLTHQSVSQSQLSQEAQQNGWYDPQVGMRAEDFGKLLAEKAHVPVESHYGGTIAEIEQKLAHQEEVFVGVNSAVEWLPDQHSVLGQVAPHLFDPQHFAGQSADHIVQVIGVENPLDPQHTAVIVNDSGSPEGCGVEIPLEQFQQAIDASDGFIASTAMHTHHSSPGTHSPNHEQMIFGCKVSTLSYFDGYQTVSIDSDRVGYSKGNSFYWDSDHKNVAGTWSCDTHHAYTKNGTDLGYAKTWSDAALLIFKQNK